MWYTGSNMPILPSFEAPFEFDTPSDYCRTLDDTPTNIYDLPDVAIDFAPPASPFRSFIRPLYEARDNVTAPLKRRRHKLEL